MKLQLLATTCALCALAAAPTLAGEPGNLMNMTVTTRMQMGASQLPPNTRTDKTCISAKKPDLRQMVSRNKSCKISDYRQLGGTISYHISCTQPPMSGDGKFTLLANGGIHGTVHAHADAGGRKLGMDMTEDGTRIGSCDYKPQPLQ